jgi:hypothetical protein
MTTKPADTKNTILINGHYAGLKKEINKGDTSYDLFIKENQDYYKIGADNSNCFYSGLFLDAVKVGQPIQIYLKKSFIRKSMIVCITSNNIEYLSFNCANQEIESERILMPMMLLGLTLLVCGFIYKNEIKAQLKKYDR